MQPPSSQVSEVRIIIMRKAEYKSLKPSHLTHHDSKSETIVYPKCAGKRVQVWGSDDRDK